MISPVPSQLACAEDPESHERHHEDRQLEDDRHREKHHRHERVVVLRAQLDVELVLVEVREVMDRRRQRDEVAEDKAAYEEQ